MDGKKKTRLHTDNNHIKHMHHKNIKDKKHRTSMDQALKRIVANNGPHQQQWHCCQKLRKDVSLLLKLTELSVLNFCCCLLSPVTLALSPVCPHVPACMLLLLFCCVSLLIYVLIYCMCFLSVRLLCILEPVSNSVAQCCLQSMFSVTITVISLIYSHIKNGVPQGSILGSFVVYFVC